MTIFHYLVEDEDEGPMTDPVAHLWSVRYNRGGGNIDHIFLIESVDGTIRGSTATYEDFIRKNMHLHNARYVEVEP